MGANIEAINEYGITPLHLVLRPRSRQPSFCTRAATGTSCARAGKNVRCSDNREMLCGDGHGATSASDSNKSCRGCPKKDRDIYCCF
jgi:hypothetical protein